MARVVKTTLKCSGNLNMFSFIFSTSPVENVERIEAIGESSPLPKSDANIIRRTKFLFITFEILLNFDLGDDLAPSRPTFAFSIPQAPNANATILNNEFKLTIIRWRVR